MRKLRDVVIKIAKEKDVYVSGGADGRLRDWDRELEMGKIRPSDAIGKVKGEFKYSLDNEDYEKIEREIK